MENPMPDFENMVLDDLSDLVKIWDKHRANGITPKHIRSAIIMCCRDIAEKEAESSENTY